MAISPRMLAVLQKVDAKREEHFANLRERGKQEAEAEAKARVQKAAKKTQAAKKKPPISPRTLAIIRRVDAQTDAVDALGKRHQDAEKAMRRAKAKKKRSG